MSCLLLRNYGPVVTFRRAGGLSSLYDSAAQYLSAFSGLTRVRGVAGEARFRGTGTGRGLRQRLRLLRGGYGHPLSCAPTRRLAAEQPGSANRLISYELLTTNYPLSGTGASLAGWGKFGR